MTGRTTEHATLRGEVLHGRCRHVTLRAFLARLRNAEEAVEDAIFVAYLQGCVDTMTELGALPYERKEADDE